VKVALVHDWLTGMRGGERCLEHLCRLFPEADIYTLFHFEGTISPLIEKHDITTSFLQRFPFVRKHYRSYLPFYPLAIESLRLRGEYDLIISTSHCVAKGIIPDPETVHISYCFTPMRYIWDRRFDYFGRAGRVKSAIIRPVLHYLRMWDVTSSQRVSHFVAISKYVRRRIGMYYHRPADVVYPPVDCSLFHVSDSVDDYYLMVSAFAPYKRLDYAIRAFNGLGRRLIVVGKGPEEKRLKMLGGKNIEFMGWLPDRELRSVYARCRALIFPGVEDFGMIPVEVQASGRPVIALARGGVLESVVPYRDRENPGTGLFFNEPTSEAIIEAVRRFEDVEQDYSQEAIRANALRFDTTVFMKEFKEVVQRIYGERKIKND